MCGSSTTSSDTHSITGPEEWMRTEGHDVYDKAKALVENGGLDVYEGPRVADYGSQMDDAGAAAQESWGKSGASFDASKSVLDELRRVIGGDLGKSTEDLMNPYVASVLDPILRRMGEQGMAARNQISSQATLAGAYGDARHGVEESMQRSDENRNTGELTSKAYSDAYDRALAQANKIREQGAGLSGLYQQQGAGETTRGSTFTQLMAGLADKNRAVAQSKLDAAKEAMYEKSDRPLNQYAGLNTLLSNVPHNITKDEHKETESPDNSGLGVLGTILGVGLKLFSDERLKTEIVRVGELDNGLPVYKYRYITGGPTQIGLMAQDVELLHPEAVGLHSNGFKMVDYAAATE